MEETKSYSRSYLIEALFLLTQKTSFDDITVGDLCLKAGVSRVTYYRNFETKHDVIRAFFREWGKNFSSEIRKVQRDLTAEKVARLAFEQFKLEKDKMKLLRKNHLIYLYLESLTNGFRDLFLQFGKLRVEQSYILSGGLFNFSVWWLEEDCKTPVDDMVKMFLDCFRSIGQGS